MLNYALRILGASALILAGAANVTAASAGALTVNGAITPANIVTVGTTLSGAVQEVSCSVNAPVAKDQVCVTIDPRPYERALAIARANLAAAEAQLGKDAASLANAKLTFQRKSTLAAQGIVARVTVNDFETTYQQAEAQLALDTAIIEQRKAQIAAAELTLGYTKIASPISGIILETKVAAGETVTAGLEVPALFVVASDLRRLRIVLNVGEADVGRIKAGDAASILAKAFPDRHFNGKIGQIGYVAKVAGGQTSYPVVVDVDNADLALRPGMSAAVEIATSGQ